MTTPYNKTDFHYIRYGIASDQKYLLEFINNYGNLIVNAKTVAFNGKSLSLFLHKIIKKVNFTIDPETHAFQHDRSFIESTSKNNKGKSVIKKSIQALIKAYGAPIDNVVKNGKILQVSDFDNTDIRAFCKRVIDFQCDTIKAQESAEDVSEYYDFLVEKKKITDGLVRPEFIIAPYFYLNGSDFSAWLELNIKCIHNSIPIAKQKKLPLAAELVISQDILIDDAKMSNIIDHYNSLNIEKIFLWIDSFSEHDANEHYLKSYIDLLRKLNKPVVDLYGGYLSIILKKTKICENLVGVSHGMGFGEDRSVVPVGGGVPAAKFYLPSLHKRLIFRNALESIRPLDGHKNRVSYFSKICDCPTCKSIIKNDPLNDFRFYGVTKPGSNLREFPTSETIDNCIRHYMYSKIREYSEPITKEIVKSNLDETYYKLKGFLPENIISHCQKWIYIIG